MPTVFLRPGKMEFELPVSFFVYPRHQETEFEISSVFVFCFLTTLKMAFKRLFSCFVSPQLWTTDLKLSFPFFVFVFRFCDTVLEPEEYWHFLSLTMDKLETRFLLKKIINQEPLYESKGLLKKFSSCHGIKKRRSVADGKVHQVDVKKGLRTAEGGLG